MERVDHDARDIDAALPQLAKNTTPEGIVAEATEPGGRHAERRRMGGNVRLGTARIHPKDAGINETVNGERRDHRHGLADGEKLGRRHFSIVTGAGSMSSNVWFSPAMAQTNE